MVLLNVPISLRDRGRFRFQVDLPANFTDRWLRMTTVMSDADFLDSGNGLILKMFYSNTLGDRLVGGEVKWVGNPTSPEMGRPDIAFPVRHKRNQWDLRGKSVVFELDLRTPMNIGVLVEGITF